MGKSERSGSEVKSFARSIDIVFWGMCGFAIYLLVVLTLVPDQTWVDGTVRTPPLVLRYLPPHAGYKYLLTWFKVPHSGWNVVLYPVARAFGYVLAIPIVWQIRQILKSAVAGDPFQIANARRLRTIGVLVCCIPISVVGAVLAKWAILSAIPGVGVHWDLNVLAITTVAGGAMFALAEVFAYGVRLREDVEGTV